MTHPQQVHMILCNCPDRASALGLADAALSRKLAACVNLLPEIESHYHWQGKLEQAREIPLLLKTSAAQVDALCVLLDEMHPYDVPEILAWPASHAGAAYAQWVAAECQPCA